jgi:peroxiredoxin
MLQTIKNQREATAWQKHYDQFAPKAGDIAPDFELLDVNGENPVTLSQFRGKNPVALVFGSYT